MPGPNNVYKPKTTGFLIATIALIMVVIVILIATILIVAAGGDASVTTDPVNTNPPVHAWDTTITTTIPQTPITTPPTTTAPQFPSTIPGVVIPGADSLEMDISKVGQGALVQIDKSHFYTRDGLVTRSEMNSTTATVLGFEWVKGSTYYQKKISQLYLEANTVEAFTEMMKALYEVTGTGIVQIRNAYYYDPAVTAVVDDNSLESVEHSTGCFVDLEINNNGITPLNHPTYKVNYYDWLVENCWKYGFVHQRDTANYSTFRYIGIAHAAALHNEAGLSFETYLTSLTAYKLDGDKKKVIDSEGNEWWIYYHEADNSAQTVYVPVLGDPEHYQVSGDNKGGFIVAVNTAQFAK
ncbi:MAG: hypothetical protein IJW62_07770 [Clostridia bacterium]|nr:hypothetical protein [Clostridia bacterium]